MRRRIHDLIWLASLGFSVATIAFWVRSRFRADAAGLTVWGHHFGQVEVLPYRSSITIEWYARWPGPRVARWTSGPAARPGLVGNGNLPLREVERGHTFNPDFPGSYCRPFGGFHLDREPVALALGRDGCPNLDYGVETSFYGTDYGPETVPLPHVNLVAPIWVVPIGGAVPLALLTPPVIGSRLRARGRRRSGRCLGCGYDLRHSPGRCPECGATATA